MRGAPAVAVLDVNETLVDLRPLRSRFEAVGAPGHLLETWFASTLRDGFALTAAGAYADFQTVALAALTDLLSGVAWDIDGATRLGMLGAWLNRDGRTYPDFFEPPTVTVAHLSAIGSRAPRTCPSDKPQGRPVGCETEPPPHPARLPGVGYYWIRLPGPEGRSPVSGSQHA